jgi:hypothetical protein
MLLVLAAVTSAACRSFNGTGNNPKHALWGSAHTPYLRSEGLGAYYADGTGSDLEQSNLGRPPA